MPEENESIAFIERIIERSTSHLIRNDGEIKGIVEIRPKTNGTYDIKVNRGTDTEPQVLEELTKEQMISILEDRL